MSDETTNSPITVTLKGGPGYEAAWIVVRGNSLEEVETLLEDIGNSELNKLVQDVNLAFRSAGPEPAIQSTGGSPGASSASSGARVYLDIPFAEKDAAKAAGAKWDKDARKWYDPNGNTDGLAKWR